MGCSVVCAHSHFRQMQLAASAWVLSERSMTTQRGPSPSLMVDPRDGRPAAVAPLRGWTSVEAASIGSIVAQMTDLHEPTRGAAAKGCALARTTDVRSKALSVTGWHNLIRPSTQVVLHWRRGLTETLAPSGSTGPAQLPSCPAPLRGSLTAWSVGSMLADIDAHRVENGPCAAPASACTLASQRSTR